MSELTLRLNDAFYISLRVAILAISIGLVGAAQAQRPEHFTAWTAPVFPAAEYVVRRAAALGGLRTGEVLLVPSAEGTSGGETFRQLDDFEYFLGLEVPRSVLAIDSRTGKSLLFVPHDDPRFTNPGRLNDFPGRPLAADPAIRALSGVDSVLIDDALPAYLATLAARGGRLLMNVGRGSNMGPPTEATATPFDTPSATDGLARLLRARYSAISVGSAYELIARLRMVKSPREIAKMREAARVTSEAIARGARRVTDGVTERSLTGSFIADCYAQGAQRVAFTPIIKSGENSLWPWRILGAQYDRRDRAMHDGELVSFDVGCERDHYASDVGRTFPVAGRFTVRQRELVEMVRGISDAVIAAAKPGVTLADLQKIAEAKIPAWAKPKMLAPLYFGHHLGLDSGDPSIAEAPLAAGMVFTIEPWFYDHEAGVAAFLEDEILIVPGGRENLTATLPRDAAGLERMRQVAPSIPRTVTHDGVLAFRLDRAVGTVTVEDLLNGEVAERTPTCTDAQAIGLTDDDVSFVVRCPRAASPMLVNTASYAVSGPPVTQKPLARRAVVAGKKTEVLMIGTIHSAHRTSKRFSLNVLRGMLRNAKPDLVLTEIAPNRLDAALREYRATGTIVEPRVVRFPEYVDVLFPLTRELSFTIVPTAGWSKPMDAYRTAALKRIEADPARRAEWLEHSRATAKGDSLTARGGADDPRFVNSAAYDVIQTEALEPYDRLFNAELGPGGWTNINRAHFANIARALDAHRGEGRRVVITYGAGHRAWMLRELRKRSDVVLLDVDPFIPR
jgi:Xaa-Pro aminopeptidase